jgi:hypothetical protein
MKSLLSIQTGCSVTSSRFFIPVSRACRPSITIRNCPSLQSNNEKQLAMQAPPIYVTDYSHRWDFFVPKVGMFYSQCGNVLSPYWF